MDTTEHLIKTSNVSFDDNQIIIDDHITLTNQASLKLKPGLGARKISEMSLNSNVTATQPFHMAPQQNLTFLPIPAPRTKGPVNKGERYGTTRNNKVAPAPIDFTEAKNGATFGQAYKTPHYLTASGPLMNGNNGSKFGFASASDQDVGPNEYNSRKEVQSIRSSFDYVDVPYNDAMNLGGDKQYTGRGSNFFRKGYREDQRRQGDESLLEM